MKGNRSPLRRPPSRLPSLPKVTVGAVEGSLNEIAPPLLAEEWDNVGLIVGDREAPVRRVLLAIDLTPAVLEESRKRRVDFLVAYHPPLFRPVRSLCAPGNTMEALVHRCIRLGIAVYSPHTALDAAPGGTNDLLAELCGVSPAEPLRYVPDPSRDELKLVLFVPAGHADRVADALSEAGAGRIGDYTRCSFRLTGQGTFRGGESTSPTVGRKGRLETVEEIRLEMVVPTDRAAAVVAALRSSHPYEEPAFDLYPLRSPPVAGIGRHGALAFPTTLGRLAARLKRATGARAIQAVGDPDHRIEFAVVVAGSAGSLPFSAPLTRRHVIVTGEIRHHDALSVARRGCAALALGHWTSERPVLKRVGEKLRAVHPGLEVGVSLADREPLGSARK